MYLDQKASPLDRTKPVYLTPNNLQPSPSWQVAEKHYRNRREDDWKNRCSINPDSSACKIFDD